MISLLKNIFLDDRKILVLIFINAVAIFAQGYQHIDDMYWVDVLDNIISILFITEMLIKASHFGWKDYLHSSWNKFDVFLILLSVPSLAIFFVGIESLGNLSFILAFRVFRVFKFLRFVQFFPEVEHILRSAQAAIKASFVVLVGFFVFIFIMSIMSCYFFRDIDPVHFQDPITAFYSTFKVFTVEAWNEVPETVVESEGMTKVGAFFAKGYFIILFIVGGIFGLSIVNSIFVDAMVSDNNESDFKQMQEKLDSLQEQLAQLNATLMQQKTERKEGDG